MLKRLVDIRKGEGGRTALSFLVLMLVVGAYTVVKAVRDAIFLSSFGLSELSAVAIGLAVATGFVVTFYLRASTGVARDRVVIVTHAVIAVSLVALWAGLSTDAPAEWLSWALYIWSSLYGVFLVMQAWSLVGELFDVREARRLFGIVGAGSVVGGLTGGAMAQLLAPVVGSAQLLLVAAGMLALGAVLARVAWGMRPASPVSSAKNLAAAKEDRPRLFSNPLGTTFLRFIGAGMLLATIVTTLLDWQLKAIAKDAFDSATDEMTAFFGGVLTFISATSLLLQLLGVSGVLRRWGVGVARLALPAALLLGAAAILGHAAIPFALLWVAAGAKVSEGGLRFSLDRVSRELTWLAVPASVRSGAKAFVDTVVDRFATGLTGVVWLTLAAFGLDAPGKVHLISVVVVGLALAWLWVCRRTQREYVDAFRDVLSTRSLDVGDLRMSLGAERARDVIEGALESGEAGEIRFALYLLEGSDVELPDLTKAVEHEDPEVSAKALALLASRRTPGYRTSAAPALEHHDHDVREAAVLYLRATEAKEGALPPGEPRPDGVSRYRFVHELICLDEPTLVAEAKRKITQQLEAAVPAERAARVRLLGAAPAAAAAELLQPLLGDEDPAVVEAALNAAGRARAVDLVPALSDLLRERRWRPRALTALLDMGAAALRPLMPLLHDRDAPPGARRAVARLAGAASEPWVAEELSALLVADEPMEVYDAALRALTRLRQRVGVELDAERLEALAEMEIRELHLDLRTLRRGSWAVARERGADEGLFARMLRERADGRLARIFRILSLGWPPGDIQSAFRGVRSPLKATRTASMELIDNVVQWGCKQPLLVVLGDADAEQFEELSVRIARLPAQDQRTAMTRLLRCRERWAAAVTAWYAGEQGLDDLAQELLAACREEDHVAPVARRSLAQLAGEHDKGGSMSLTVVEKAMKLQNVDVLSRASSEDLAYVAQIADEMSLGADEQIYESGDPPDALYVVVRGAVRLKRGEVEIGVIGEGEAFGSWALFDDEPRMASATTTEETTLLKVNREDFMELLADRANIVNAVFKAMVERIRALAKLA